MKKTSLAILAVVVTVAFVAAASALVLSGIITSLFSATGPPELKEASVAISLGGGYNGETGMFDLEGTAQNMGKKDAKNCRVEVTFFNVDTHVDMKTVTITIGDVPAESSKNIKVSIPMPGGSRLLSFRTSDPQWD